MLPCLLAKPILVSTEKCGGIAGGEKIGGFFREFAGFFSDSVGFFADSVGLFADSVAFVSEISGSCPVAARPLPRDNRSITKSETRNPKDREKARTPPAARGARLGVCLLEILPSFGFRIVISVPICVPLRPPRRTGLHRGSIQSSESFRPLLYTTYNSPVCQEQNRKNLSGQWSQRIAGRGEGRTTGSASLLATSFSWWLRVSGIP